MKVGVVADTHGYLDPRILELFDGVDAILHAGDFESEDTIVELDAVAPVYAVSGNCDYLFYDRFPRQRLLELGGKRILLCHIYDNLGNLHPGILKELRERPPDVLVFGHTHAVTNEVQDGVLFFNPGYAGKGTGRDGGRSVGMLELDEQGVCTRILGLED